MTAEFGVQTDANPEDGRDEAQADSDNARTGSALGPEAQSPSFSN